MTFTPESSRVTDGKAATKVTFKLPGCYVLRGFANDGALTGPADVNVTVNPASTDQGAR